MLSDRKHANSTMSVSSNRFVALIGSSGGGTATLGHTLASEFLDTIIHELESISEPVGLKTALFISLDDGKGMDSANGADGATLFHLSAEGKRFYHGSLNEINARVENLEVELSKDIQQGNIQGLICVSCSVSLFSRTLKAAADKDIPVTGTGGTSLSLASSKYKINLVGNSGGSVATTPLTKAISFSHALAQAWDIEYKPWNLNRHCARTKKHYPTWKSVLNSCLPVFWGVALCKRLLLMTSAGGWIPNSDVLTEILEVYTLPAACSIIMANSRRTSPSVLMGSIIASSSCPRTILGGLLAGIMVSALEERLLYLCIVSWNFPATMTNLVTTGLVGVAVAISLAPISGFLSQTTDFFRTYLVTALVEPRIDDYELLRVVVLGVLGCLFCYGSKVGWYHSIYLPLILVEMELGDPSVLGAMDELTLVLVSAGICAGIYVTGTNKDSSLVKRGLKINLLCGDFIEACYPFMEKSVAVNFGGYVASACSVAILTSKCKSSAYLPFPLALWLADDWKLMLFASMLAMGISFAGVIINDAFCRIRAKSKEA